MEHAVFEACGDGRLIDPVAQLKPALEAFDGVFLQQEIGLLVHRLSAATDVNVVIRDRNTDLLLRKTYAEYLGGKAGLGLGDIDGYVVLGAAGAVLGPAAAGRSRPPKLVANEYLPLLWGEEG